MLWGKPQGRLDTCTIKENIVKVKLSGNFLRLEKARCARDGGRKTEDGRLAALTTGDGGQGTGEYVYLVTEHRYLYKLRI